MIEPIDPTVFVRTPMPTETDLAIIAKINEIIAAVNAQPNEPVTNQPPVPS